METQEQTSLSAIEQHRIAHSVFLLRDMNSESDTSLQRDIYQQVCDLETSHISEVISGDQRTKFEFEQRDGKLYALQPNGIADWTNLHRNGLLRAQLKAQQRPGFGFYVQMAKAELDEAYQQEAMIASGEPATMVVFSLCGDDVASHENLEAIGRDPGLQRGYVRTAVFDGQKLHLYSHSIDGLTPEKARALCYEHTDAELPQGSNSIDILNSRIYLPGARHELVEKIAPTIDAGTYDFVLQQKDLLSVYMQSLEELSKKSLSLPELADCADQLRYDIMASFKQRHEGTWVDYGTLSTSVSYAGDAERSAGTQFSGCDTVVSSTHTSLLSNSGYVNTIGKESWSWRMGTCRVSSCPSKKNSSLAKVGPCDVCKNCQGLFDSGMELKEIESLYVKQAKKKENGGLKNQTPGLLEYWEDLGRRVKQEQELKRLQRLKREQEKN